MHTFSSWLCSTDIPLPLRITSNGHELETQLKSLKIYQIVAKKNTNAQIQAWIKEAEKFKLETIVRSSLDNISRLRVSYEPCLHRPRRIWLMYKDRLRQRRMDNTSQVRLPTISPSRLCTLTVLLLLVSYTTAPVPHATQYESIHQFLSEV